MIYRTVSKLREYQFASTDVSGFLLPDLFTPIRKLSSVGQPSGCAPVNVQWLVYDRRILAS